jgi:hypothetical protein
MKQNYQTLSAIRKNLSENGRLPLNLQAYLIDSIAKVELGEPLERAFLDTVPNVPLKGKSPFNTAGQKGP